MINDGVLPSGWIFPLMEVSYANLLDFSRILFDYAFDLHVTIQF